MIKYALIAVSALLSVGAAAQEKEIESPFVVESLKDAECLKAVMEMEAFLFKTDINSPNTSEFLFYGLDIKSVEENYPYLIEEKGKEKHIRYEMLIPILVEAIEETSELIATEANERRELEEEFSNYKITMENHLQQLYYQIEMLKSEMTGINDSKSVGQ